MNNENTGIPYYDTMNEEGKRMLDICRRSGSIVGGAVSFTTLADTTIWFAAEDFAGAESLDSSYFRGIGQSTEHTKVFIKGRNSPILTLMPASELTSHVIQARKWASRD